jgi:hypothetical protein
VKEKRGPQIENCRHLQVIPQGSGGSYCQVETADFGQDTNIDLLTETVTESVVLLVTTVTLSTDNSVAVPQVIISNSATASRSIIREYKSEAD